MSCRYYYFMEITGMSDVGRQLLEEELGGFFSKEDMPKMVIQIEARVGEEVAGASAAYENEVKADNFFRTIGIERSGTALSLAGIAVRREYRGKGVGAALARRREEIAKGMGYSFLIGEAWLESPSPSIDLFLREGMREVGRIANYWKKKEAIPNYCPLCGNICSCTAVLLLKKID